MHRWFPIALLVVCVLQGETGSEVCADVPPRDRAKLTGRPEWLAAADGSAVSQAEGFVRSTNLRVCDTASTAKTRQPGSASTWPSVHGSRPLEYFIGSGTVGRSYLYSLDGFLYQAPVSWYCGAA